MYSDGYLLKLWRQAVLLDWNYHCAVCGEPGSVPGSGNLECHHIVRRGVRVLRYDRRNGIAVCPDCHRWLHTLDGREWIAVAHPHYKYIKNLERVTLKQMLVDAGMTRGEWLDLVGEELKTRIAEKMVGVFNVNK